MCKHMFSNITFTVPGWKECAPFTVPCCCEWTNYEVKYSPPPRQVLMR